MTENLPAAFFFTFSLARNPFLHLSAHFEPAFLPFEHFVTITDLSKDSHVTTGRRGRNVIKTAIHSITTRFCPLSWKLTFVYVERIKTDLNLTDIISSVNNRTWGGRNVELQFEFRRFLIDRDFHELESLESDEFSLRFVRDFLENLPFRLWVRFYRLDLRAHQTGLKGEKSDKFHQAIVFETSLNSPKHFRLSSRLFSI